MHPEGYFALVLTPPSSRCLVARFATLAKPIAHHVTVRHGTRNRTDLPAAFAHSDLGRPFRLRVSGVAASTVVQAVVVALVLPDGRLMEQGFSENAIPHVTVATDGKTEPFEANAMLARGYQRIEGPLLDASLVHTWDSGADGC